MNSGVYTITNIISRKIYVGCAKDIPTRISGHKYLLKRGIHDNNILQKSWNKHGEKNFEFDILDLCSPDIMYAIEHYWSNILNTKNRIFGYNLLPTDPRGRQTFLTEETKRKISQTNTGRKRPDNTLRMTGKRLSQESIEKMRRTKTGKKMKSWTKERREKFMTTLENNRKLKIEKVIHNGELH